MRIAVVSGGPVDPQFSGSQSRVCSLIHALLEQGHGVVHAHFEATGYDRAPFLRGLSAVYPALRLEGHIHADRRLTDCAAVILTNFWIEPELEAALNLVDGFRGRTGPTIVFDSMDCLATTYIGTWPDERIRRFAALEAELRAKSKLSVFISRCEVLKALRLCPGLRESDTFVLSNCYDPSVDRRLFDDRQHICFVGSAAPHNTTAAIFFLGRVWSRLARLIPEAEFHLVGSVGATLKIDGPAELIERVRTVGLVADLAEVLGGYRVSVVPVLTGSGIKDKTLESMARGTPVVTSVNGVEGMPLTHNQNVVLATEDSFAAAVAALYRDRPRWEQISAEGVRLVERRFSTRIFRDRVRRLIERIQR